MIRHYKVTVSEGQLMLLRVAVRNWRKSIEEATEGAAKARRLFELEKTLDRAEVAPTPKENPS